MKKVSMRKSWYFLGIILGFSASLCFAQQEGETFTVTTYYPSPYGSYNELTTASNTYLATTSGNVGIGTTNPTQKLDVAGYVKGQSGLCIGNDCRDRWSTGVMVVSGSTCPAGYSPILYHYSGDTCYEVRSAPGGDVPCLQGNCTCTTGPGWGTGGNRINADIAMGPYAAYHNIPDKPSCYYHVNIQNYDAACYAGSIDKVLCASN